MDKQEARDLFFNALVKIAPEAAPNSLDLDEALRDQIDIDSIDFLNLIAALSKEIGSDIPESDYPKLRSVNSFVDYLSRNSPSASAGKETF